MNPTPTPVVDLDEEFMAGSCHALALAMNRQSGYPLVAVLARKAVLHVCVREPGGEFMDIHGKVSLPIILDAVEWDPESDGDWRVEDWTTKDVFRAISRGKLSKITPEIATVADETAIQLLAHP